MFITRKIKTAVKSRIEAAKKITRKDVWQFCKDAAPTLAVIGAYTFLPSVVDAAVTSQSYTTGIDPLDKPVSVIVNALTGPIPVLITGGGIALGGMSWAMGWEQQAMMRGVKVAGGGAVAMGAGKFLSSVLDQNTAGVDLAGMLFQ